MRNLLVPAILPLLLSATLPGKQATPKTGPAVQTPLNVVKAYADALVSRGRDTYGPQRSPLFAAALTRNPIALPAGEDLKRISGIARQSWGIRPGDRMLSGANPMHDQNLYQVLYALSKATGEPKYAKEADAALKWFFVHCQSPETSLMAWGEHIGWDFYTETVIDKEQRYTHEFFRPWELWDATYLLAPRQAALFARGLWDHQIYDQQTGEFSRHAQYNRHAPGTQNQYPRHGGFYIATWAEAYARTKDPVFLKAIETISSFYARHRHPKTGAIPSEVDNPRSMNRLQWPGSSVSLAVDMANAAAKVPAPLSTKLLEMAAGIDEVYVKQPHDLSPGGRGFVTLSEMAPPEGVDIASRKDLGYSRLWATGYGEATDAQSANLCLLRYRQSKHPGYRTLIIDAARRYLDRDPDLSFPLYPGTMGDVIFLLLDAHELSGDPRFLARAKTMAAKSIEIFFDASSPLPKASSHHDHYEAITRADTLAMALLRVALVDGKPRPTVRLVWNDR